MIKGRIKNIIVREQDILIDYTNNEYPLASGHQLMIGREELLGFPFVGSSIEVKTDETNRVIHVLVNGKTILQR